MANRVLLGNRSTGGYGLYVSKNGEDVLTTTNALQFDSRMGASFIIHSYGENSIAGGGAAHTITHNLGYRPVVAIRWSESITSGKATAVYNPAEQTMDYAEMDGDEEVGSGEATWGMTWEHISDNAFKISNASAADGDIDSATLRTLYYAWVIFHEDSLGGILSL